MKILHNVAESVFWVWRRPSLWWRWWRSWASIHMYIESMKVKDEYRRGENSDVGALALLLLNHPHVKAVSSCIYITEPYEVMLADMRKWIDAEEREESFAARKTWREGGTNSCIRRVAQGKGRETAAVGQFLCICFYHDIAVARKGNPGFSWLLLVIIEVVRWNLILKLSMSSSTWSFLHRALLQERIPRSSILQRGRVGIAVDTKKEGTVVFMVDRTLILPLIMKGQLSS